MHSSLQVGRRMAQQMVCPVTCCHIFHTGPHSSSHTIARTHSTSCTWPQHISTLLEISQPGSAVLLALSTIRMYNLAQTPGLLFIYKCINLSVYLMSFCSSISLPWEANRATKEYGLPAIRQKSETHAHEHFLPPGYYSMSLPYIAALATICIRSIIYYF